MKHCKKIISAITFIFLCFTLLILPTSAASDSDFSGKSTELSLSAKTEYYCREALLAMPDSEALLYAYDKICEGVASSSEEISVYNGSKPLSKENLEIAFDAYRRDHTEHFWLGNQYTYSFNLITVTVLKPTYVMSGEALDEAKEKFAKNSAEILSLVDSSMSEMEIELTLHKALAARVTYIERENAHSAYGAIVDGYAVCEGYAEALAYLLQCSGIQSFIALGSSINPSTGSSEAHAWNYVKIDGSFYHTDLTWNDQGINLYHAYFNVTDEKIKEDHIITEPSFALPECSSTEQGYFNLCGGLISGSDYSAEDIAKRLKDNDLKASFYIDGDAEEFMTFFAANASDIASKAGISGSFSYIYYKLGREIIYEIILCKHENLTKVKENAPSCTEEGNYEYYVCECGRFFESSDAKSEITDLKKITAYPTGHTYSEKIEEENYLKSLGTCVKAHDYYYACSVCGASAGKDPFATDKIYAGSEFGSHSISDSLSFDGTSHFYSCKNSGCSHREGEELCSGGEASCSKAAICSVCKNEYGSLLPHEYNTDEYGFASIDGHAHKCKNCDAHDNLTEHSFEDGTICSVCGYEKPENAVFEFLERLGIPKEYQKLVLIGAVVFLILIIFVSSVGKRKKR